MFCDLFFLSFYNGNCQKWPFPSFLFIHSFIFAFIEYSLTHFYLFIFWLKSTITIVCFNIFFCCQTLANVYKIYLFTFSFLILLPLQRFLVVFILTLLYSMVVYILWLLPSTFCGWIWVTVFFLFVCLLLLLLLMLLLSLVSCRLFDPFSFVSTRSPLLVHLPLSGLHVFAYLSIFFYLFMFFVVVVVVVSIYLYKRVNNSKDLSLVCNLYNDNHNDTHTTTTKKMNDTVIQSLLNFLSFSKSTRNVLFLYNVVIYFQASKTWFGFNFWP